MKLKKIKEEILSDELSLKILKILLIPFKVIGFLATYVGYIALFIARTITMLDMKLKAHTEATKREYMECRRQLDEFENSGGFDNMFVFEDIKFKKG